MTERKRREYGSGGLYQRKDGLWVGTIEAGWTSAGTRRRLTVSDKTQAGAKRKLRDKRADLERGVVGVSERTTVKAWAHTYLAMRRRDLSPKGFNAAASPIRRWVVPTIGHKRLGQLTPGDVRAVADAQRAVGRQAGDTHRVLMTMLRAAIAEGHPVPERVLHVKAPQAGRSDRQSMTVEEGLACIEVAATLPHGARWLFTLLYGQRQGECLGLTWDAIDLDAGPFGEAVIEWQLQALPYDGDGRKDKNPGFRVPDGFEARHLVGAYHLIRPKTRAGYRVAPLLKPVRDALVTWRDIAPANPWGLVWPAVDGRPAKGTDDRDEWKGLQNVAGVGHPAGRPYHVHECRNFAATMLLEADVPEHVITDLLGHSTLVTSLRYRTRRRGPLLEAMQRVGERLQLGG